MSFTPVGGILRQCVIDNHPRGRRYARQALDASGERERGEPDSAPEFGVAGLRGLEEDGQLLFRMGTAKAPFPQRPAGVLVVLFLPHGESIAGTDIPVKYFSAIWTSRVDSGT